MSESKYAYPSPDDATTGMTLRAHVASEQMAAIVTAAAFNQTAEDMLIKAGIHGPEKTQDFFAFMAVGMADALIKELNK